MTSVMATTWAIVLPFGGPDHPFAEAAAKDVLSQLRESGLAGKVMLVDYPMAE